MNGSTLSAENGVASTDSAAVRSDFVGESVIKEPFQRVDPQAHSVQADTSIEHAGVNADADLHAEVLTELWDGFDAKPVDNLCVKRGRFYAGYKATFHVLLLLIGEPKLWGIFVRAPRRTWCYARKYEAKTNHALDASGGQV